MKNGFFIYIKPFDDYGNYTDWIDVTDDAEITSANNISFDLDNTEYDIGVYRSSNFKITLRNDHGKYSDADLPKSIFKYKRSDSLVRVSWDTNPDHSPYCGFAICGEATLSEEIILFEGLLNDESAVMNLDKQLVDFYILGKESMFLRTIVPFGSISNGDLFSEIIYACLNQTSITNLLTVDSGNISCGIDLEIDSITGLQNKTVQEGLNKLLLASNSVLYIKNDTIYVAPRTATVDVKNYFYGQASANGIENIQTIADIKNGTGRLFNFFSWENTTTAVQDSASVTKYGAKKKNLDFDFITSSEKKQQVMESLLDEFKDAKQEFTLYSPLNYVTYNLNLLDRVSIDYPAPYLPGIHDLPICGQAICGDAWLPDTLWSFLIDPLDHYKIIGKAFDLKKSLIRLRLRLI